MNAEDRAAARLQAGVVFFLGRTDIYRRSRALWVHRTHIADERGYCAGCVCQREPVPWPCIVRTFADETLIRAITKPREAPE